MMGIYSKKWGFPNIVTEFKFLSSNPDNGMLSKTLVHRFDEVYFLFWMRRVLALVSAFARIVRAECTCCHL